MAFYERHIRQQTSVETESTDELLKRHENAKDIFIQEVNTVNDDDDDNVFSGKRLEQNGSAYTTGSIQGKMTQATLTETDSGTSSSRNYDDESQSLDYNKSIREDDEGYYYEKEGYQYESQHRDERNFSARQKYLEKVARGRESYGVERRDPSYDDKEQSSYYDDQDDYREPRYEKYFDEEEEFYDGYQYKQRSNHGNTYYSDALSLEEDRQTYQKYVHKRYEYEEDHYHQDQDRVGTGYWEETSQAFDTVDTRNQNLQGIDLIHSSSYNSNYYEEEHPAFDYSVSQHPSMQHYSQAALRGHEVMSPLQGEEASQDSISLWEGELHNGSLLDSADSRDELDRRPASKSKKASVTYKNGEFQMISGSVQASRDGSKDRSRSSSKRSRSSRRRRKIKDKRNGESSTVFGTSSRRNGKKGRRRRRDDPIAKIVDGIVSICHRMKIFWTFCCAHILTRPFLCFS